MMRRLMSYTGLNWTDFLLLLWIAVIQHKFSFGRKKPQVPYRILMEKNHEKPIFKKMQLWLALYIFCFSVADWELPGPSANYSPGLLS